MMRGPDIGALLSRAILAGAGDPAVAMVEREWRRWASATFTGARHRMVLSLPDTEAARAWLAALPEAEFAIRGHLVADIVVTSCDMAHPAVRATVEALTVEDC